MERPTNPDRDDDTEPGATGRSAHGPRSSPSAVTVSGDDVRSAYARWAPVYDLLASPTIMGRERAAKRVNQLSGHILEAGVGTGSALPLYRRTLQVTGVDLSHDMLKRARERVATDGLTNVRGLYEMDLMHLAFPDAGFDGAVSMFTITAVPDPGRAMAELARVVRPGGTVLIASHFRAERGPWVITDRLLTPFARKLGWNPAMDKQRLLGVPGLELVSEEMLPPMGLVSLLTFRRV